MRVSRSRTKRPDGVSCNLCKLVHCFLFVRLFVWFFLQTECPYFSNLYKHTNEIDPRFSILRQRLVETEVEWMIRTFTLRQRLDETDVEWMIRTFTLRHGAVKFESLFSLFFFRSVKVCRILLPWCVIRVFVWLVG